MKSLKLIAVIFLILSFSAVTLSYAIEKNSLLNFFQEYDVSEEKIELAWDRLPYAVEKGHIDVAEFLVLNGDQLKHYLDYCQNPEEDIFVRSYTKHPLITAVRKGYVNLIVLMLSMNKNTNINESKTLYVNSLNTHAVFDKKDFMHVAITESPSSYDTVSVLIAAGIDVNKFYYYRNSTHPYHEHHSNPISTAIECKKLNIAKLLIENGANIESELFEKTPLYKSVEDNYTDCVVLLLSYGADPLYYPKSIKISPLELAIQKGYWDIVDLLLNAAVNKDVQK